MTFLLGKKIFEMQSCNIFIVADYIQSGASCKKCSILGAWQGSENASVANELVPLKSDTHIPNNCFICFNVSPLKMM